MNIVLLVTLDNFHFYALCLETQAQMNITHKSLCTIQLYDICFPTSSKFTTSQKKGFSMTWKKINTLCTSFIMMIMSAQISIFPTSGSMMWGYEYVEIRNKWPRGSQVPHFYIRVSQHHGFTSGKNRYLCTAQ